MNVRCHLKEFGSQTPANPIELFYLCHLVACTIIKRAFGSLQGPFKIFSSRSFFPFKTQVELALVECIPYNFILSGGADVFIPLRKNWRHSGHPQKVMRERKES